MNFSFKCWSQFERTFSIYFIVLRCHTAFPKPSLGVFWRFCYRSWNTPSLSVWRTNYRFAYCWGVVFTYLHICWILTTFFISYFYSKGAYQLKFLVLRYNTAFPKLRLKIFGSFCRRSWNTPLRSVWRTFFWHTYFWWEMCTFLHLCSIVLIIGHFYVRDYFDNNFTNLNWTFPVSAPLSLSGPSQYIS